MKQPNLFLLSMLIEESLGKLTWANCKKFFSKKKIVTVAFSTAACCSHLSLNINLTGREGLTYNVFSGEYQVTDEYTDNGEQIFTRIVLHCCSTTNFKGTYPVYQNMAKANQSLAHTPGPAK